MRARQAAPMAEQFAGLKSLTIEFAYLTPHGQSRNREVKFTVNVDRASSVLVLDCMNPECVGGDFELSKVLGEAVAAHEGKVSGEIECPGWTARGEEHRRGCAQRISYVLTLGYHK